MFFLQSNERSVRLEPVDLSRLAETLSSALCIALSPKLPQGCGAELAGVSVVGWDGFSG